MPLYEFDCAGCGAPFEKLVRSSQKVNEVVCPTCGSAHVTRRLSTFAVRGGASSGSAAVSTGAACAPGGL
jgi:putative FmdB family regulatory protein